MTNKRFGCLGIGLLVVLGISLLLNLIFIAARSSSVGRSGLMPAELPKFDEAVVAVGSSGFDRKIAVISLRGMISSIEPGDLGETMVDDLKLQLKQAAADDKVKAIVLYIDSPGGEVTASDTIYQAVRDFRDGVKKPVVVYMGSLAASGGYYAACGGGWLMANETTFTGSIGVIMQTLNYQALWGKVGLETHTFKSGKFKDMLSGSREMTEEERAYVQGLVMQTYDKFVGIVAAERKLPEADLRTGIADGRVISGKDALGAKLVDQLGTVEDAYAKAIQLGDAAGATVIRYEAGFALGKLFRLLGESRTAKVEIAVAQAVTPKLEAGRLYYLPSFYAQ